MSQYSRVIVAEGGPQPTMTGMADADLVVFHHDDGTWTVYKDRLGVAVNRRLPFDDLPSRVKAEIIRKRRET